MTGYEAEQVWDEDGDGILSELNTGLMGHILGVKIIL